MSSFRFNSQQAFLTYSQAADLTKEIILNHFKSFSISSHHVVRIVVAMESHEDGGQHFHVYLKFSGKPNSRDPRLFDILDYHPNIQSRIRSVKNVLDYIKKDGDFIGFELRGDEWVEWDCTTTTKRTWGDMFDESKTAEEFLSNVLESFPRDYALGYDRLESMARKHFRRPTPPYEPPFGKDSFNSVPELEDWYEKNITDSPLRPQSLILVSPTRYGKTLWARSLGEHFYMCGLFNMDQFNPDAKYGVFDDIPVEFFKHSYKQWLGCQSDFDITDKYRKKIHVYFGRPAIFLMNPPEYEKIPEFWDADWIEGNVVTVKLTDKLY